MSFLSSHRLHWGVHHELSDNFWVHLEEMVRSSTAGSDAQTAQPAAAHADTSAPGPALPSLADPQTNRPEA